MKTNIEKLILEIGPSLTSEVAAELIKRDGLSKDAARQRLSRADSDNIKRIYGLFPKREVFMYHKKSFGSSQYWTVLVSKLLSEGTHIGRALAAIKQRGGIVPYSLFGIICGSPIGLKKHVSHQSSLDQMVKAGLVHIVDIHGIGKCISLEDSSRTTDLSVASLNAQLLAEKILLDGFSIWAKNIGLVSFDKVKLRNNDEDQPNYSCFSWDFTAPSYIGAVVRPTNQETVKPGFVVADLHLGSTVTIEGLEPFLYKCRTTRSLPSALPCIQFLFAENFESDAFSKAKKNGILPVTPESIFGRDVAIGIRLLISVLTAVGSQVMELDKLNAIFEGLSKFEGAIFNLRGALFEFLVAQIVKINYRPDRLDMNYVTRTLSGEKAESDVAIVLGQTAHFIECKGYSPYAVVPDEEVLKWLYERVPKVRKFCLEQHDWSNKKLVFEFWTTGKISSEAKEKIEKTMCNTKQYEIRLLEVDKVKLEAKKTNDNNLINLLENHFLTSKYKESVKKSVP